MQQSRTLLFVDPGTINHHRCRNIAVMPRPITKDDRGALLTEGFFADPPRPWEPRIDNGYPNVIWDEPASLFRMYYTTCLVDEDSASTPLAERPRRHYHPSPGRVTGLCYAESRDGVEWTTPELGLVEFAGSRANNILMVGAHGTGVFLDPREPDGPARFKAVTKIELGPDAGYMATTFSEDGIHFATPRRWPHHNPAGDTHNFALWDPAEQRYVVITRIWKDGLRICATSFSDDFVHWSEPTEILRGGGPADQVYSMPVFRWADQYLGLASIYHDGDRDDEQFDTVDCVLTSARSWDSWDSPAGFAPVLPRGPGRYPDGAFDCSCVYAAAPVRQDGKLWVYYFGGNGQHTDFRESALGRGWWEDDKFAFLAQRDRVRPGVAALGPVAFSGLEFELLAEVDAGGEIRCELMSARSGEPIEGFDAGAADPIRESGWSRVWIPEAARDHLFRRSVVIVVHVTDARLFAMRGDIDLIRRA